MDSNKRPVFAAFAVSRTGNRGAVSMLESAIDHLTSDEHPGEFQVFTVYPKADRALPKTPHVHLQDGTPRSLVLRLIPLSILYRLAKAFRLQVPVERWGSGMAALVQSDVCLMIGGTTFSDAQLIKVIYNVACTLPAMILGKPIMWYSQTLGPFKNPLNRLAARFCLSRADFVVPRGPGSLAAVRELDLPVPVEYFADSAFSLVVPEETEREIRERYAPMLDGKTVVGISINSIVEEKCQAIGIDHHGAWLEFIQYLQDQGYFILMIPHSMRQNNASRHNNDLISVAEIMERLPSREGIHVVDEPYDSKALRVVVGLADYYVASRFHSMISALCNAVPVSVFGWGYQKYREVLHDFELEDYCHDASELSGENLIASFEAIKRDGDSIRERMQRNFPAVRASSMRNHLTAWSLREKS